MELDQFDEQFVKHLPQIKIMARLHIRSPAVAASWSITSLIQETYLRLRRASLKEIAQHRFKIVISRVMNELVIERARYKRAAKRGRDWRRAASHLLDEIGAARSSGGDERDFIDLFDALASLAEHRPRQSATVYSRFFQGLTIAEVAEAFQVSEATVERDTKAALEYLRDRLSGRETE